MHCPFLKPGAKLPTLLVLLPEPPAIVEKAPKAAFWNPPATVEARSFTELPAPPATEKMPTAEVASHRNRSESDERSVQKPPPTVAKSACTVFGSGLPALTPPLLPIRQSSNLWRLLLSQNVSKREQPPFYACNEKHRLSYNTVHFGLGLNHFESRRHDVIGCCGVFGSCFPFCNVWCKLPIDMCSASSVHQVQGWVSAVPVCSARRFRIAYRTCSYGDA